MPIHRSSLLTCFKDHKITSMKSSLTLLFLLVTSICSFACSCFDAGDFCTILPNAIEQNTLVVAGAPVRIIGHGMEFKISKVISGTESRSKITIWGDPGYLCRVYVTGFKQEDRLLMILNPVRQDRLEESTGNTERVGDYFISACGEFLVRLNGNNASNLDCINLEDEVPAPILVFPNPTSSSFRLAAADDKNKFTFLETPKDGQRIRVKIIPGGNCGNDVFAFSQELTLFIRDLISAEVSIVSNIGAGESVCNGTEVTFQAIGVNAGARPVYKWIVEGDTLQVGNFATFKTTRLKPNQRNLIQVQMTSSIPCVEPNPTISPAYEIFTQNNTVPAVKIEAIEGLRICRDELANFQAIPISGGAEPVYQWYINGEPEGQLSSDPLFSTVKIKDGDQVSVDMFSNLPCADPLKARSNILKMEVRPHPVWK